MSLAPAWQIHGWTCAPANTGPPIAWFVIVICAVATDDRAPWKGVMAPLLIGLFIFTAVGGIGPASGGSYNPARSLDPAIWNFELGKIWIYLLGPLAGALVGGAIWVIFSG